MRRFRWLILLLLAGAAVYLNPGPVLRPMGAYLVDADIPVRSDCIFVLGGDLFGQRVLRAADLYRLGLAPKVFVSGPGGIYGHTEDELEIQYAREKGATDVPFVGIPNHARSTATEATEVLPKLREAGCRSVLVVTSNFHTRRARRILTRLWPGIEVRMASAPTEDFDPDHWWQNRNYQKTFFFEWAKTFADWFGI